MPPPYCSVSFVSAGSGPSTARTVTLKVGGTSLGHSVGGSLGSQAPSSTRPPTRPRTRGPSQPTTVAYAGRLRFTTSKLIFVRASNSPFLLQRKCFECLDAPYVLAASETRRLADSLRFASHCPDIRLGERPACVPPVL